MFKHEKQEITDYLKKFRQTSKWIDLESLWPGFKFFPVAIYDNEDVFIGNYKGNMQGLDSLGEDIYHKKWEPVFSGCTSIKFNDSFLAICDYKSFKETNDNERFFSLMIHEMFHAFQISEEYKMWANEFDILKYRFTGENIYLRKEETKYLVNAYFEKSEQMSREYLNQFFTFRERRYEIYPESVIYEMGNESIEGTATYIENKTYSAVSAYPEMFLSGVRSRQILSYPDYISKIRYGTYYSGMFLAYVMDRYIPGWKDDFLNEDMYLYEYFKSRYKFEIKNFNYNIDEKAEEISREDITYRNGLIERYKNSEGYNVIIKNAFLRGFDPMNIIFNEKQEILNLNFFYFEKNGINYYAYGNSLFKLREEGKIEYIIYSTDTEPVINDNYVEVNGIGNIKANSVKTENKNFYIE